MATRTTTPFTRHEASHALDQEAARRLSEISEETIAG
jgi:hypothetical protein